MSFKQNKFAKQKVLLFQSISKFPMNIMKKVLLKLSLICFLSLGLSYHVKADPGGPDGDPELPFDPGSWVLVAAGVGYGVKKWRDAKQQNHKDATITDITTAGKE